MDNPYRIHSSIGFSLLQLLLLTTIAYPAPPPTLYQNVALVRLGTTVYFSMYRKDPFYLKLDCASIVLKIICDALYVGYIITNYTYIFGIFDIFSDIVFFVVVNISLRNGETSVDKISKKIEEIHRAFIKCCCGWEVPTNGRSGRGDDETGGGGYRYTSLPSEPDAPPSTPVAPMYTFGGRQAFKPGFYTSSWGREYLNTKVAHEFDTINRNSGGGGGQGSATITGAEGTEYIRFDDTSAGAGTGDGADMGAAHYANIFVSPYFTKDGTPITAFSGGGANATCLCNISGLLFTYNLLQFIYQLMMYSNIMLTCGAYTRGLYNNNATAATAANMTGMTAWLC
jgi:hypothetical protein